MTRHPDHDRIAATARSWYTRSTPEMGYRVEERRFGFYSRNEQAPGFGHVTVRGLAAEQVPDFLAESQDMFAGERARILVDDRDLDAEIGPALVAAGYRPAGETVFLAHLGPLPAARVVPGMSIETVSEATLAEYVVTKLKAFADSEAEPDPERVRAESALRRAEMAGMGVFLLARVAGEPAAIIGSMVGEDRFIFLLATRAPFRGRGIARALLCHVLQEAVAGDCRAVIINADPSDTPIQLYRRLGFTDEIYWHRVYSLPEGDRSG